MCSSLQVLDTLTPKKQEPQGSFQGSGLQPLQQAGLGCQIRVGTLDAELEPLVLSKAAQHGLPPSWVTCLAKLDPHQPQV